jgi:octaprenyl-diphosphate synthase
VLLSAACFGSVPNAAREMAVVVELIHSATLLHDDVVDDGDQRRGADTARLLWGNAVSVLAGDALLVHSLKQTAAHAPELMTEVLETLARLVSGEVVQLRGRRELDLSQATYDQILSDKTASLFRLAAWSGATLGGASAQEREALAEFGERLGMAFQLVDDVLDYSSVTSGKTLCADLIEGKVTLPLVLAAKNDAKLLDCVMRIRDGLHDEIGALRAKVLGSGACDMVRQRARQETQHALLALERVPDSPARSLLRGIARQLAVRDS